MVGAKTKIKWEEQLLDPTIEVSVPELVFNETRGDWMAIPELAGPVQDYYFMVPLFKKIREINLIQTGIYILLIFKKIFLPLPGFEPQNSRVPIRCATN